MSMLLACEVQAQTVRMQQQWYDHSRKLLKQEYAVLTRNSKVLHGSFKAYYINGNISKQGQYTYNEPTGYWEYFYESGKPKMAGRLLNGKPDGFWNYYYENGHLSQTGTWSKGKKEGLWNHYYESGTLESSGEYANDKNIGLWKYFYEDGHLKATTLFEEGIGRFNGYYASGRLQMRGTIVDGKSTGLWQYYYEQGGLKAEGNEKEGLKEGYWVFYHPSGKISGEGNFENGKSKGPWTYYHTNGAISSQGEEEQGQKQGYWKLFYDNGALKGEGNFEGGDGPYKEYFESGKLKVSGQLKKGKSDGAWKYYYEDGSLEGSAFYNEGEGIYSGFYKDGTLKMQGRIIDGRRSGIWQLYREDGSLAGYYKAYYQGDVPLFEGVEEAVPAPDTIAEVISHRKPDLILRKEKPRYFRPAINEVKTFIISTNPLAIFAGALPVSVEYYMKERLGYEIGFTYLRNPFLRRYTSIQPGEMFRTGLAVDVRQKFYHPHYLFDTWYFGHELRLTYTGHEVYLTDVNTQPERQELGLYTTRAEYSLLIGSRLFAPLEKKGGFTLDVFGGLGVGYRQVNKSWQGVNADFDNYFTNINRQPISIPVRLGLTLGYYFK